MKKTTLLLSTALLLSLSTVAMAQPSEGRQGKTKLTEEQREAKHAERMKKRIAKLTKALSLTPVQVAQAKQLFTDSKNNIKRLRASGNDMRSDAMRDAKRLIRWETDDKLHAMLTSAQREKLRKFRRQMRFEKKGLRGRHGMRGHHGRRGDGMRGHHGRRGHGKKSKNMKNARKAK